MALRSLAEVLAKSPALKRADVVSWWTWREAVGARVAERSAPERIDQQTLWVVVEGSAWAAELSLLSTMIVQRLRAKKLEIQSLRFKVGSVRLPERQPATLAPTLTPLSPELEARLNLLDHDPELKAAIAEAARLCEGRQSS